VSSQLQLAICNLQSAICNRMLLQTLSDHWQIRPLDAFRQGIYPRGDDGWLAASVPGHWQQLPGLERHSGKAVYRCRFGAEHAALSRHWLRLNGAFYRSRPYLNGVDLGPHEGYFIPNEQEVTGLLRAENQLLVELDCPDERDKLGKRMVTGVFSHWDCFDPQANPGGIWLPVELHASGPVRLQHTRLLTLQCDERVAQLRFDLDLDADADREVTLRLRFAPRTWEGAPQLFEQRRMVRRGTQSVGGLIKLREPRLWWTHDLGRPDLYDVTVEVVAGDALSDSACVVYGARSFELRDWIPHLNGVRFLAKGNNYPPGDMRIATMTRARYDQDLQLARDCHMNMLRVHAHVEHPALYAAADAAGILLWQDFPLQWIYDRSVLPEARRQAREMARLLGGHASVGVWCMHNEPVVIEDTADESLASRLRTFRVAFGFGWNRDVLDTQLAQVVEQHDPTRPVVRSSGELDIPYVRKGTDAHAYFGWYRNYGTLMDAEKMRQRFPANLAFVTEFGAQSFPNLESSRRFMPDPLDDAAIEQLVARHNLQADIMSNWVPWRAAGSLAEVIELTQEYQVLINRFYIDRLRFHKYRPTGGIVPFLFVDAHPAVTWSVIDYWRVPKRSYYALQQAFRPQYAFCLIEPRPHTVGEAVELPIYAVNDARRGFSDARLEICLRDPDGAVLAESRHRLELPADCTTFLVERLRLTPTRPGDYSLTLALSGVEHELRQRYTIEAV
jgi:beta-mannosidase